MTDLHRSVVENYKPKRYSVLSFPEYLEELKNNPLSYANAATRLLKAIGEPQIIDSSKDVRLSKIFSNRIIKIYPVFKEFYGMEAVIENIVSFFTHAAQGLEEKKQVLYLLGPVGSAKSSLAELLKKLMEVYPIYVLTINREMSPIFETPLGLFKKHQSVELGVPEHVLHENLSPWAIKRLIEVNGDTDNITITKLYPSKQNQIAISKTEPGDENNQDTSSLVGKIDIRQLGQFSQNDTDAYSYSGGLCMSNQGLLEFVEMFKAPIKILHPLLTATQEGNYIGTETIGAIPFDGVIVAHSNEAEWEKFKKNKNNEAFIDRISVVKVPYILRYSEEVKIYEKLLEHSELCTHQCAPKTLELLAQLAVFSRLTERTNTIPYLKLRAYNGDNIRDEDCKLESLQKLKEDAGQDEGMSGLSTRFAYKILAKTFNFDHQEIAANPIHLFYVIEQEILKAQLGKEIEDKYFAFIEDVLKLEYKKDLEKDIQSAYLETYDEFGQNIFDRYVKMADYWLQDQDYIDPETLELLDRSVLDTELQKVEKPAGIVNVKDFRHEVVTFCLRVRSTHNGCNPNWKSYGKLRTVIERNMFNTTESLLPIISFNTKDSKENQDKHQNFLSRMIIKGYTEKQVRLCVEWFNRVRKN